MNVLLIKDHSYGVISIIRAKLYEVFALADLAIKVQLKVFKTQDSFYSDKSIFFR